MKGRAYIAAPGDTLESQGRDRCSHLGGQHVRQRRAAVADRIEVEEARPSDALRHKVRHRVPICAQHGFRDIAHVHALSRCSAGKR